MPPRRSSLRAIVAAGASASFALSCLGGGFAGLACSATAAATGILLALLGRGVEGAVIPFVAAMTWMLLGLPGSAWPLLLGAALMVVASLEEGARLARGHLLALAGLASYTALYTSLLYVKLPEAVDLGSYTLAEFSSPAARSGLVLLGGVYGALLAYGIARPQRSTPRLAGSGGVLEYLRRRHRAFPLWAPLVYILSGEPLLYMLIGGLIVIGAVILAYTRTESLDAALIASYAALAIALWLAGAPTP